MAANSKSPAGTPNIKVIRKNSGMDLADGFYTRRSALYYLFFLDEVRIVERFYN